MLQFIIHKTLKVLLIQTVCSPQNMVVLPYTRDVLMAIIT